MQAGVGSGCLLAALQQQAIVGADSQRRDLRQGVLRRLEDDQQHSDRCRHLLQLEAVCKLHAPEGSADGLFLPYYEPQAVCKLLDLLRLQLQAFHEVVTDLALGFQQVNKHRMEGNALAESYAVAIVPERFLAPRGPEAQACRQLTKPQEQLCEV